MLDALRMESRALIFLISGVFALTCQASDQVYAGRSGFFAELSNDISVHSQERFDQDNHGAGQPLRLLPYP